MPLQLGAPGSEVSQARECARGLSQYSGTVEVLSSSWTPSLLGRVVVQLRERWQWDSDLLWWFGWSPQFFGFTCVVERQLDPTSVTARLRVVVLCVEVCHGVGTVVIVVSERRLTAFGLIGCGVPSWWHSCVCVPWWYLVMLGGEVEVMHLGDQLLRCHCIQAAINIIQSSIEMVETSGHMELHLHHLSTDEISKRGLIRRLFIDSNISFISLSINWLRLGVFINIIFISFIFINFIFLICLCLTLEVPCDNLVKHLIAHPMSSSAMDRKKLQIRMNDELRKTIIPMLCSALGMSPGTLTGLWRTRTVMGCKLLSLGTHEKKGSQSREELGRRKETREGGDTRERQTLLWRPRGRRVSGCLCVLIFVFITPSCQHCLGFLEVSSPPPTPPEVLSLVGAVGAPRRLADQRHRRRCTPPPPPPPLLASSSLFLFSSLSSFRDYTLPINVDDDEDDDDDDDDDDLDPEFTTVARASRRSYAEEYDRRRGLGTSVSGLARCSGCQLLLYHSTFDAFGEFGRILQTLCYLDHLRIGRDPSTYRDHIATGPGVATPSEVTVDRAVVNSGSGPSPENRDLPFFQSKKILSLKTKSDEETPNSSPSPPSFSSKITSPSSPKALDMN
ncbi:hypothetical protein Taro_031403 [Colocasia esculenta]|uniref:Uncharacterized protein n=1 Tax=Colocasia esculenta TaxID=4460 RepID=A0A843W6B4_COLES|nr:hypothetical protein [Colocasia esculenta]